MFSVAAQYIVKRTNGASANANALVTSVLFTTKICYTILFNEKKANTNETEPHFDNRTEITVQRANSWLQKTCFIWHIFFRWCDKKRSIRQRHQVTRFHTAKDERIPYPMQYIWFVLMSSFLLVRSDIFSGYGLSFFLSSLCSVTLHSQFFSFSCEM